MPWSVTMANSGYFLLCIDYFIPEMSESPSKPLFLEVVRPQIALQGLPKESLLGMLVCLPHKLLLDKSLQKCQPLTIKLEASLRTCSLLSHCSIKLFSCTS